jgi:hypothetical protein
MLTVFSLLLPLLPARMLCCRNSNTLLKSPTYAPNTEGSSLLLPLLLNLDDHKSHLCSKEGQLGCLLVCQLRDWDGVFHDAGVAGEHAIHVLPHLQQQQQQQQRQAVSTRCTYRLKVTAVQIEG